ncbi:Protein CBG04325 [Caenorhabditis briggsae]|uniref:Uncharacterized protein n=2 Tax=Caenorhabditis briggsae TaxID=6238 RepID=A0AAE9DIW1_CAEBR|nr:Protein CBG04325 [Caenorhabditis briggsae]ULU04905.1 hypothetical protein L3Y34_017569 [Caenorhabditis briggsae]CAP25057.1 Protein CBG04325 [Caenorhabditis briggsae]
MNPLSYQVRKCIITHFDFNTRNLLSERCPDVRYLDKVVPSKINNLYITGSMLRIDCTTYQLGVVQIYENGKTPEFIQRKNRAGGFPHDVDEYGVKENLDPSVLKYELPQLKREKKRIEQKMEKSEEHDRERLSHLGDKIQHILLTLEHYENASKPPFLYYLQLIISSQNYRKIEILKYQTDMEKATGYLIDEVFKDRKTRIEKLKMLNFRSATLESNILSLKSLTFSGLYQILPIFKIAQNLTLTMVGLKELLPYISNETVHFKGYGSYASSHIISLVKWSLQLNEERHYSIEIENNKISEDVLNRLKMSEGAKVVQSERGAPFPEYIILNSRKNLELEVRIYRTSVYDDRRNQNFDLHVKTTEKSSGMIY